MKNNNLPEYLPEYKIEKSDHMLIEGCDPAHTTKDNIFNVAFNATMKKLKKKVLSTLW